MKGTSDGWTRKYFDSEGSCGEYLHSRRQDLRSLTLSLPLMDKRPIVRRGGCTALLQRHPVRW